MRVREKKVGPFGVVVKEKKTIPQRYENWLRERGGVVPMVLVGGGGGKKALEGERTDESQHDRANKISGTSR